MVMTYQYNRDFTSHLLFLHLDFERISDKSIQKRVLKLFSKSQI